MNDLKPCPFCGGMAKLSFADVAFGGQNYIGEKRLKYRFQVICNRCHARGRPVVTDWLINPNPWISKWRDVRFDTERTAQETEKVRPWAERAINEWNRRKQNECTN